MPHRLSQRQMTLSDLIHALSLWYLSFLFFIGTRKQASLRAEYFYCLDFC